MLNNCRTFYTTFSKESAVYYLKEVQPSWVVAKWTNYIEVEEKNNEYRFDYF